MTAITEERIWHALCQLGYENTNNYAQPKYTPEMLEEAKRYLWHEEHGDDLVCVNCGVIASDAPKSCDSPDAPLGCHVFAQVAA